MRRSRRSSRICQAALCARGCGSRSSSKARSRRRCASHWSIFNALIASDADMAAAADMMHLAIAEEWLRTFLGSQNKPDLDGSAATSASPNDGARSSGPAPQATTVQTYMGCHPIRLCGQPASRVIIRRRERQQIGDRCSGTTTGARRPLGAPRGTRRTRRQNPVDPRKTRRGRATPRARRRTRQPQLQLLARAILTPSCREGVDKSSPDVLVPAAVLIDMRRMRCCPRSLLCSVALRGVRLRGRRGGCLRSVGQDCTRVFGDRFVAEQTRGTINVERMRAVGVV